MGKFKTFLTESDVKSQIISEIDKLSDEELHEFGEWLYDQAFGEDDTEYEGSEDFDKEEVLDILESIEDEDLDYVLYMLEEEEFSEDDEDDEDDDELEERVSTRMISKDRNKKKNKRFSLSKSKFRAGKSKRKKAARASKIDRKKYYRKNKARIKKYNKSYSKAVASGRHKKKIRR